MNISRKIQLTAAAVIANSALALGLLSAGPAFATTCNPRTSCFADNATCQAAGPACAIAPPPGCRFVTFFCIANGCNFPNAPTELVCLFTTA